ncbi:TonB-dependent receptor domain-containing protein [Novosphingobium resinovorum]
MRNKNWAVYGQIGYEITDKLKLNLGARYSWDKVSACGGAIGTTYATEATCLAVAGTGAIDGVGTVSNKGQEPSWTIGLDYKPNPDWLLYIVSRRGYRGANVNTPLFETPSPPAASIRPAYRPAASAPTCGRSRRPAKRRSPTSKSARNITTTSVRREAC